MVVSRPSLLLSRILQFRDVSPLLVLTDSTFQSAYPLLQHFESSARSAKVEVIRIGWQKCSDVCTLSHGDDDDHTLPISKSIDKILQEIKSRTTGIGKILLSIPDLNDFLASNAAHLSTFLSSLISIAPGKVSVCAIYHEDIPLLSYPSHLPTPEILLQYLATTIISVKSLPHVLLSRDAQRKSKTSKIDLDLEGRDIFAVLGSNDPMLFLELEHRRKSGRGVKESVVFSAASGTIQAASEVPGLNDDDDKTKQHGETHVDEDELGFKISLSDRQKAVRDGVVLPHFSAQIEIDGADAQEFQTGSTKPQSTGGGGGGGNIYYEPDSGDDFDVEDPDDDLML